MPWPGPHLMSLMSTSVVPGPKETQSSPVPMVVLRMLTWREWLTWMPSVLGLVPGAVIDRRDILTSLQCSTDMWICWLFNSSKLPTLRFVQE